MKDTKQIKHSHASEDTRISLLEQSIGHISQTLLEIKHEMREIKHDIKTGFDKIDAKFEKVNSRIDNMFYWILGIAATLGVGVFLKLFIK